MTNKGEDSGILLGKSFVVLWSISNSAIIPFNGGIWLQRKNTSPNPKRQPDDSSYDDIVRELAFDLMVQRGLKDSDERRTISNEVMKRRIKTWQK